MIYLLDTNVLSELAKPQPSASVVAWIGSIPGRVTGTTAVTAAELRVGVLRMPAGARRERVRRIMQSMFENDLGAGILPFDDAAATHYADVMAARLSKGRPTGMADAQIAAICRTIQATLVTRNIKDFQGVGVDLVNPWIAGG